ncbi:peptide chain release factor 2 [candidate division KSB1 bacterium]|nr:peptide chain release factor 2 [candidate division KSB1 bacterium]
MYEEIFETLADLKERLEDLRVIFEVEKNEKDINELEKQTVKQDFWDDYENAQDVMRAINSKKTIVDQWNKLNLKLSDLQTLAQLAEEEEDEGTFKEVQRELVVARREVNSLEFKKMMGKVDDKRNAILTIHPGAGGTESQDWAQMLMRMYLRWIENKGFESQVLDLMPGEEAGIKSVTIDVIGEYAYGYLQAEVGVHRLVRISPFDANSRRHTSFASVFVYPEINNEIEININSSDLKVDTYRASGAGGQHVNKTSSAVRITHIPSGIVVQCQSERSQHMNRTNAMKILMSRLYQLKSEEEQAKLDEIEKNKKEIAWGSQIRSYIFQPYNLVKDHRTKCETSNTQAVMDGDIDDFIYEFLLSKK